VTQQTDRLNAALAGRYRIERHPGDGRGAWRISRGNQAAGTVARETPLWQAWIQERFPMPAESSTSE
jgi:hypothetical protein